MDYCGIAASLCLRIYISRILTLSHFTHRDWPVEKLKEVKVADALKHPNWSMGKKITVDSATLFNKVCYHFPYIY